MYNLYVYEKRSLVFDLQWDVWVNRPSTVARLDIEYRASQTIPLREEHANSIQAALEGRRELIRVTHRWSLYGAALLKVSFEFVPDERHNLSHYRKALVATLEGYGVVMDTYIPPHARSAS